MKFTRVVEKEGDSYLTLAESVLRRQKTPLSAKQILELGYLYYEVPRHLHGRTQHKTLGARLSEDILNFKKRSRFFRTSPGRFFLREFISDKSIPLAFRTPIVARRRSRQLKTKQIVHIQFPEALPLIGLPTIPSLEFAQRIRANEIEYLDLSAENSLAPVYSFTVIRRQGELLIHTKSAYGENRPDFRGRRMIGFTNPIDIFDLTLFDQDDHGIVTAGLSAVCNDLDLEFSEFLPSIEDSAKLLTLLPVQWRSGQRALLGCVVVDVPDHFRPSVRRLAIGAVEWWAVTNAKSKPGYFDPWSREVLDRLSAELAR